jgi:hypothetical protein
MFKNNGAEHLTNISDPFVAPEAQRIARWPRGLTINVALAAAGDFWRSSPGTTL